MVDAIEEQLKVREIPMSTTPLGSSGEVAEHNVRVGEISAFTLCKNYPQFMLEALEEDIEIEEKRNANRER